MLAIHLPKGVCCRDWERIPDPLPPTLTIFTSHFPHLVSSAGTRFSHFVMGARSKEQRAGVDGLLSGNVGFPPVGYMIQPQMLVSSVGLSPVLWATGEDTVGYMIQPQMLVSSVGLSPVLWATGEDTVGYMIQPQMLVSSVGLSPVLWATGEDTAPLRTSLSPPPPPSKGRPVYGNRANTSQVSFWTSSGSISD